MFDAATYHYSNSSMYVPHFSILHFRFQRSDSLRSLLTLVVATNLSTIILLQNICWACLCRKPWMNPELFSSCINNKTCQVCSSYCMYRSVLGISAHGRSNITCDFGLHGRLPRIKSHTLYRSCYSGPLKCGTRVLARDTTVVHGQFSPY